MYPCSICGKGGLVRDTRDVSFTYKGQKALIKGIPGQYCSNCGHGYYGPDDDPEEKYVAGMDAFVKQVDELLQEQAGFAEPLIPGPPSRDP